MDTSLDKQMIMFSNDKNMNKKEIENLFRKFGNYLTIQNLKKTFYIKYGTEAEADLAMSEIGRVLGAIHPMKSELVQVMAEIWDDVIREGLKKMKKGDIINKSWNVKNPVNVERTLQVEDSGVSKINSTSSRESMPYLSSAIKVEANESVMSGTSNLYNSRDSNVSISIPRLVDEKNIQKIQPVILGNLPDNYSLEDVCDLVTEVKPFAFTEIKTSKGKNLKFCGIYLKSSDDIAYLKRKLNKFVIAGKELILVEPSELFSGIKWIL